MRYAACTDRVRVEYPVVDNIKLTNRADGFVGSALIERIFGLDGDDRIRGLGGADTVAGGAGDDRLFGEQGADRLLGQEGDDYLSGGAGNDFLIDLAIPGSADNGRDRLVGGSGNDTLFAGDGDDILIGGVGRDRLLGGNGDDRLLGGVERDVVSGGRGNDVIIGGSGSDIMFGGAGRDDYYFAGASCIDVIRDFEPGEDEIFISAPGVRSIADLIIREGASGTVIFVDGEAGFGADRVFLRDVTLNELSEADFTFGF